MNAALSSDDPLPDPAAGPKHASGLQAAEIGVPEPLVRGVKAADPSLRLHIRVQLAGKAMFGPGKAQLLEAIRETGSIARAGQAMAMSYKRAWSLVEEMNRLFSSPLVVSTRGGARGGGAELTQAGVEILAQYRCVVAAATTAAAPHLDAITAALKPPP